MEILSPWSIQNNWTVFNSTSAFFIVVSGVKFVSAFGNCNVIQIRRLLFFFSYCGLVKQGVGLGIRSILVVFDCKLMDVNCLGPTKALRSD